MSYAERELFIEGVGFWASRLPSWEAARTVLRGDAQAAAASPRPVPSLLPAAERRRAPDTVVVAVEVASRACESADREPAQLPSVFASTHGDLAISDSICDTLAKNPTLTSPIKFHNSVHNAAAGYWTIGTGCLEPYTALSAFTCSFAEGFLESAVQAEIRGGPVLYVAYDIEARGPAATMQPSRGVLGGALVLASAKHHRCVARVKWDICNDSVAQLSKARPVNAQLVEGNAMADCLVFYEALADARPRELFFALTPSRMLRIQVVPSELA